MSLELPLDLWDALDILGSGNGMSGNPVQLVRLGFSVLDGAAIWLVRDPPTTNQERSEIAVTLC